VLLVLNLLFTPPLVGVLDPTFPLAPAWGQAVSEEEGDVRAPTSDENSNQAANRPRRFKKPSTKAFGPEWRN